LGDGVKIDHITLLSSAPNRSGPYYAALLPLLGLHMVRDSVWTDGAGFYLQFLAAKEGSRPYERYGAGLNHLGFGASSAEEVHAIRATMKALGFEVPEVQLLDGSVALFMKDPDGIRFEVTFYPPGGSPVD
jgi:lactoylglutathione lyase